MKCHCVIDAGSDFERAYEDCLDCEGTGVAIELKHTPGPWESRANCRDSNRLNRAQRTEFEISNLVSLASPLVTPW